MYAWHGGDGGELTYMANSVFELLDKLLLTAWLLKFAQVKRNELSPVH